MTAAVTGHAIDRYLERVDPRASREQAKAAMLASAGAIKAAAAFGCGCIRQGTTGAKLILKGECVVTVLGRRSISGGNYRSDAGADPVASQL